MSVSRVDSEGDWTFGQGLANYAVRNEEINQSVITRLRSFKNDWYLDMTAHIDWLNILSNKSNEATVIREIERVVLQTDGILSITNIEIVKLDNRNVTMNLEYVTIYNAEIIREIGIIL